VKVRSGVCCKSEKILHVLLHSVTSLSSTEVHSVTGYSSVAGIQIAQSTTYLHVNTEIGTRVTIRVPRSKLNELVDEMMLKVMFVSHDVRRSDADLILQVVSARAIHAATSVAASRVKKNTPLTMIGHSHAQSCCNLIFLSLTDRSANVFW